MKGASDALELNLSLHYAGVEELGLSQSTFHNQLLRKIARQGVHADGPSSAGTSG